jgi:hypothetical protein
MGKASRSKRERTGVAPDIWYVNVTYADGTGELRAIATYREARRLYEGLIEVAEREDGIASIDVLDYAGRPLLGPDADGVHEAYVSWFASGAGGPVPGRWSIKDETGNDPVLHWSDGRTWGV